MALDRHGLFLAGEGVGDGLSGAIERVLSLAKNALALLLGLVGAATDRVTDLLTGRFLALCEVSVYARDMKL
jgi:hypothetical protein